MKRVLFLVMIFSLFSVLCFARRGVDPSFRPFDDEPVPTIPDGAGRGKVWKDPYLGMEFVWVEGGCYEMGCGSWTDSCDDDEKPVHTVCVDGFWMGKYEVTFAQYDRFCEETGRSKPGYSGWGTGDRPVIHVTWHDAKAFAAWLSRKTGRNFRLPTEAEWEYAARSRGRKVKYAWGNGDPYIKGRKAANIADESVKRKYSDWTIWEGYDDGYVYTSPVGSFAPNDLGLYDMSGNVWEWCEDIYSGKAYRYHSRNNPIYKGKGLYRVIRGGSWYSGPKYVRCADRSFDASDCRGLNLGFLERKRIRPSWYDIYQG
jgi:formylglycine-generating enzyme required for sulfatase activity